MLSETLKKRAALAACSLAMTLAAATPTLAQSAEKQKQEQEKKNIARSVGIGLGAVSVWQAIQGKYTNALILGAGAAAAGKQYEDSRKAQQRWNEEHRQAMRDTMPQSRMDQARILNGSPHQGMRMNGEPVRVTMNGEPLSFPGAQPEVIAGHTYVPLRGVFEKMGADVQWDAGKQSVIAQKGDKTIHLPRNGQATLNGQPVTMEAPAFVADGRTMVPLRFLSETMGAQVSWDASDHRVNINSNAHVASAANH
jgi:hypothetical protein